jgi:hypothetical protein
MKKSRTILQTPLLAAGAFTAALAGVPAEDWCETTNAIRMKILFSRELSQEESARLQKTDDKPRTSDFEDDSILRLAFTQHQFPGSAHYENIIANKVCERSIGAFLLPGTQLVGIFPCFSRIHDCLMHMHIVTCT